MKAIVFKRIGEPCEVLHLAEIPEPRLGDNEVLIDVRARPIQPADLAFVRGQYRLRPSFPQIAGLEGSGVVLENRSADGPPVGTRVAFRAPGAWAQRIAAPLQRVIAVPTDVSDDTASQFSINPITAWGLLDEAEVMPSDWIVLTAATSTVSNLVGAIARRRGMRVIGLVRGDLEAARKRTTADHVFSAADSKLSAQINDVVRDRRVSALLDSVGGPQLPPLFSTLGVGARIITYGVQSREPAAVTNAMIIYSNLIWKGFGIDRWLSGLSEEASSAMKAELWDLIRDKAITLPIVGRRNLTEIAKALEEDALAGRRGKVILV
jgi:NADPH:quinone reductase-like Zn-dependent oxidoreductase